MAGGTITILPPDTVRYAAAENATLGNCALYGATAVVEGVGMHACEYMTQGLVLIPRSAGANLGAGMTGEMVFVRKDQESSLNPEYIEPHDLDVEHIHTLGPLLSSHCTLDRLRGPGPDATPWSASRSGSISDPEALARDPETVTQPGSRPPRWRTQRAAGRRTHPTHPPSSHCDATGIEVARELAAESDEGLHADRRVGRAASPIPRIKRT